MAIPAIPFNYNIQQGDAQVLTTWGLVAGATSYSVVRSTDGITYAEVGPALTNSFLDDTVLVGVNYFYKIASTNGSGTSPYTSPLSIVACPTGKISLDELRLRSQQRANMVNSPVPTLPEWNFQINQACDEFYDMVLTAYEDYYVAPRLTIQTDGSSMYDIPDGVNNNGAPAMYKLYGVDLGLNGSNDAWITLKKFDFISRNRYVYPQLTQNVIGAFRLEYRLVGQKIMFIPTPSAGMTFGLWYFPRRPRLLQGSDMIDTINGWDQYIIARAAKYALDREESDTDKLDAEILFLKTRIEEAAQNRDAGQGDTVSPTRNSSERMGAYGSSDPFAGF